MKTTREIKKFTGKKRWVVFWAIVFWPIAIVYWLTNTSKTIIEENATQS